MPNKEKDKDKDLTPITESPHDSQPVPIETDGGNVTVIWGPSVESFDLGGKTVAEAVQMLGGPLSIHPNAEALIDGTNVTGGTKIRKGQTLEFVRRAGEKGSTVDKTWWRVSRKSAPGGSEYYEIRWRDKPALRVRDFRVKHHTTSDVLPQGLRVLKILGASMLVEIPPAVRTVPITEALYQNRNDQEYGGTVQVRLAFPYTVGIIPEGEAVMHRIGWTQKSVSSLKDTLYHALLPNIQVSGSMCFGDFTPTANRSEEWNIGMGIEAMFNNRFNNSHSYTNWWSMERPTRMKDFKTWERNTKKDPTFILDPKKCPLPPCCPIDKAVKDWGDNSHAGTRTIERMVYRAYHAHR